MKVFVLAIDALEHDLVEKFRLNNLKQTEYGKIDVSGFRSYHPSSLLCTPLIWASFISGVMPDKHKVSDYYRWNSNFLQRMSKVSKELGLTKIVGKLGFLSFLDAKIRPFGHTDWRKTGLRTIFDYASNPIALGVPTYSYDEQIMRNKKLIKYVLEKRITEKEFEKIVMKTYQERCRIAFSLLDQDWDLFMLYIHGISDLFGHLFFGDTKRMLKAYLELNYLAGRIKKRIKGGVLFLIVSDHGMVNLGTFGKHKSKKYGEHSNHGFYSINTRLDLQNPMITNFFGVITHHLQTNKSTGSISAPKA